MSKIEPVDFVHCDVGEMLTVALVDGEQITVVSRPDGAKVADPVLLLTPDEAHALGTKLRLAARKAGRS